MRGPVAAEPRQTEPCPVQPIAVAEPACYCSWRTHLLGCDRKGRAEVPRSRDEADSRRWERTIRGRTSIRPGLGSQSGTAWSNGALCCLTNDAEIFARDIWGKRIELSRLAVPLTSLFGIPKIANLLGNQGLRLPDVRMMQDGEPISADLFTSTTQLGRSSTSGLVNVSNVVELMANGGTLILQGSRRYCAEIDAFCRQLDVELGQTTQSGFFLTPSESVGAPLHYDFFDAFICQVEGTKEWSISKVPSRIPAAAWRPRDRPPLTEKFASLTLEPGDCLYIPRGTYHQGRTGAEPSLHLTIRVVQPYTYRTVLELLLDDLVPSLDLDRALPIGYAARPDEVVEPLQRSLTIIAAEQVREALASALQMVSHSVAAEIIQPFEGDRRLRDALTAPLLSESTLLIPTGAAASLSESGALIVGSEARAVSPEIAISLVDVLRNPSFTPSWIVAEDRSEVLSACRWLSLVGAVKTVNDGEVARER
jgi:ribosomal protein L16 Arg81 hydroxylase